nr:NADPH oxidase activator-like [Nicotiana tomentosiformis]
MVIDDDGEACDEKASLQRRQRSISAQQNAQSGDLITLIEGEVRALLEEIDLVENANSSFPVPIVVSGPMGSDIGPLTPLVGEKPINRTASVAVASQPTTPSASSPSSPAVPSLPTTATSPPPAADVREEDVPPPHSPDHGNLGHNYSPPSIDPQGRRSVSLSVSKECHLLSRLVELAIYLNPLALEKDKKKIHFLSVECMLNNAMHNARARNQLVVRLSVLEAKAAKAAKLEARLQQSEQEVMSHSQEATQLHVQLQDSKAKWAESHDAALAATERESASIERANNLEAALNSKAEEATATEEKSKDRTLELTARECLPTQPDDTNSSSTSSEFSGTEEELEENDDEVQDPVPMADPPTSPGGVDASFSSSSGGDEV